LSINIRKIKMPCIGDGTQFICRLPACHPSIEMLQLTFFLFLLVHNTLVFRKTSRYADAIMRAHDVCIIADSTVGHIWWSSGKQRHAAVAITVLCISISSTSMEDRGHGENKLK
jgi:hypothetical protein